MDINVSEGEKGTTLSLNGRFDFHSHRHFRKIAEDLIAAGKSCLTVDLSGVSFIDSSALGMLLQIRDRCGKSGGKVTLLHPQNYVQRVLKLCRFQDLFRVDE